MEHQAGSVDTPPVPVVNRSDGIIIAPTRRGSRLWPSQLNVVDVIHEQTGKYFSRHSEQWMH